MFIFLWDKYQFTTRWFYLKDQTKLFMDDQFNTQIISPLALKSFK